MFRSCYALSITNSRPLGLGRAVKCRQAISRLGLAVVLAGCTGTIGTNYQNSDNFLNLGYSDVQLSENVYRVTYAGYWIPQGFCDELALLRASDITRKKG